MQHPAFAGRHRPNYYSGAHGLSYRGADGTRRFLVAMVACSRGVSLEHYVRICHLEDRTYLPSVSWSPHLESTQLSTFFATAGQSSGNTTFAPRCHSHQHVGLACARVQRSQGVSIITLAVFTFADIVPENSYSPPCIGSTTPAFSSGTARVSSRAIPGLFEVIVRDEKLTGSQEYLRGVGTDDNECADLFKAYNKCIKVSSGPRHHHGAQECWPVGYSTGG